MLAFFVMQLDIIYLILLLVFTLLAVPIGSFSGKMQRVTLWAGKKIAPFGMDSEVPRGFQDAITPKIQDRLNTFFPVLLLLVLIVGSLRAWYLGIVAVIAILVLVVIVQKFLPNKISFYLKIIIHYMDNRIADYAKQGDTMRSDAAKEMSEKLHNLYFNIKDRNLEIPDFKEIKSMPVGGSED